MTERFKQLLAERISADKLPAIFDRLERTEAAHARANRQAILERARAGRSVCEGDGKGGVVWISPEEIFCQYAINGSRVTRPIRSAAPTERPLIARGGAEGGTPGA
jgi:hypothetical protein